MKFTHSERVFHDVKFNPPCNLYNIDKREDKNIVYGSLAGPRILGQDKNTFGYEKRFQNSGNKINPGPGDYFVPQKEVIYDFKKDLTNPKKFLKNTFRDPEQNPSIPYKILSEEKLDQKDKSFLRELSLIQNPAKAAQNLKKKEPTYSFAKSPRKLLSQKEEQQKKKSSNHAKLNQFEKVSEKDQYESVDSERPHKKNENDKKNLIAYNETIRKASKKRNEIINSIGPDFVPSLELIDLMSKMRTKYVPGPGSYNFRNDNSFNNAVESLAQITKKGAIFTSVKRFDVDKMSIIGPGAYDVNTDSMSKKGGLISKQKRSLLNVKQKTDIEFRFYINPDTNSKVSVNTGIVRSNSCGSFRKKTFSQSTGPMNGFGTSSRRFSTASSLNNEEDKKQQISEYQQQKKNAFKIQLKNRLKKLHKDEDRRSTKQDSGLLGISTIASAMD